MGGSRFGSAATNVHEVLPEEGLVAVPEVQCLIVQFVVGDYCIALCYYLTQCPDVIIEDYAYHHVCAGIPFARKGTFVT